MLGYYDNLTNLAVKCPDKCASCVSSTRCTYCILNSFLGSDNLCYTVCPARFYKDSSTRTCQNCAYDCYTCGNSSLCQTCNKTVDNRVISLNTSRCVPAPGYYESFLTIAFSCSKGCRTCLSSKSCIFCFDNYYLFNFSCFSSCPERYYNDSQGNACFKCSYDCYTCQRENICISCNATTDFRQLDNVTLRCLPMPGYYDVSQSTCLACPKGC